MDYEQFLESKKITTTISGKTPGDIHPALFPFQRDIVKWAVQRGRAAIFASVGLGKTISQLEWARQLDEVTLILAPLYVAQQTVDEAKRLLGLEVRYIRSQAEIKPDECKIYTANYEMLDEFDRDGFAAKTFGAVILDESSILKNFSGKTKKQLIRMFKDTPYKLCCTATPAPNDLLEIGNHAEFLGIMTSRIMTSIFFIHDDDAGQSSGKYRLKKHAVKQFYQWLSTWAVALRLPSDVGEYDDTGYVLPKLDIELVTVNGGFTPPGMLPGFNAGKISATEARKIRRKTLSARADKAATIINDGSDSQWLVWTGLNDEAEKLEKMLTGAVNIHGGLKLEEKASGIRKFIGGDTRVLVTKASIAGMGVNMQNCANMMFFGIDFSWESFYQAVGRIHRFGQKAERVRVVILTSEEELSVYETIEAKGREAARMTDELIEASKAFQTDNIQGKKAAQWEYSEDTVETDRYRMWLGDSCKRMTAIPDDSLHMSIYSPPFGQTIFIYSATERDLGNCSTTDEFLKHYLFIIQDLLRATMKGRMSCVHIQDTKLYANCDGARGLQPLSDMIVDEHIKAGWIYRGRVTIDKNPQLVATRNHDNDLLFVTGKRDSTDLAPQNTDYLLLFKKPGDNPIPVTPYQNGEMNEEDWIAWARAVWYGINETDVLNVDVARSNDDERHLCPLQLNLIERAIKLYSNPGETIFSPFGGIGSEPYSAVKLRRKGFAIELKPEYWKVACRNLENAVRLSGKTLEEFAAEQRTLEMAGD